MSEMFMNWPVQMMQSVLILFLAWVGFRQMRLTGMVIDAMKPVYPESYGGGEEDLLDHPKVTTQMGTARHESIGNLGHRAEETVSVVSGGRYEVNRPITQSTMADTLQIILTMLKSNGQDLYSMTTTWEFKTYMEKLFIALQDDMVKRDTDVQALLALDESNRNKPLDHIDNVSHIGLLLDRLFRDHAVVSDDRNSDDVTVTMSLNEYHVLKATAKLMAFHHGQLTDGYHTRDELYEHRMHIFTFLMASNPKLSWRSKLHHDGTMFDGDWFIAGMDLPGQGQISYHLQMKYWEMLNGWNIPTLDKGPEWDGHDSAEVLFRINRYLTEKLGPVVDYKHPACLQAFLLINQLPSIEKNLLVKIYGMPKCYATYHDKRVLLTMASSKGDIGITSDLSGDSGYDNRVPLRDLSNFSPIATGTN